MSKDSYENSGKKWGEDLGFPSMHKEEKEIKILQQPHQHRKAKQWNEMKSRKSDPYILNNLIHDKENILSQQRMKGLVNK